MTRRLHPVTVFANGSGTPALPLVHPEQPQGLGSHSLKVGAVPVSPLVLNCTTLTVLP
ncbi:unnamed protein product [Penicillium roqueforti FM164]|uniref:Uncharacterized protein n=1 Tax=Penicillium roqueforti (strain FM164) TaxID=1365484 RepID=W6R4G5_PENRF|nr:unnamed protein product [Penicillium roqueforti FM164]